MLDAICQTLSTREGREEAEAMTSLELLNAIDQLAAHYSVPWRLRNAFKGEVLELIRKVGGEV